MKVNITVIIPTKNEGLNLKSCLEPVFNWAEKIIVIDSQSTDNTLKIADEYNCEIVQFYYKGGWPKKRQYLLENYTFQTEWILLLDADEILTEKVKSEIEIKILDSNTCGYYLNFRIEFLGKMLNHAAMPLRKLSLFRNGYGGYEKRLENQDISMGDMEVHEHVVVKGATNEVFSPVLHRNYNSIDRFIQKHNEYSNYESKVHVIGQESEIEIKFFRGNVEQRRRYLKRLLIRNSLSPILLFIYNYIFRFGFLDGRPGFYYVMYQCVYLYFVSSKIYEIERDSD